MEQQRYETNINISKCFLQKRNFKESIKYALKAIEINPNNQTTAPLQILAIAKVLCFSFSQNYYSILDLPLYTHDHQLIQKNYKNVTNLLNPNFNHFPFASEAFQLVYKAWSVLSDPIQKARFDIGLQNPDPNRKTHFGGGLDDPDPTRKPHFDDMLKGHAPTRKTHFDDMVKGHDPTREAQFGLKSGGKGGNYVEESGGTFWTMCPYCYYVYEYFKVYEDCCMRCQNENCKRGFHALRIVGPAPPAEVAEKGQYYCFGFKVLGVEGKSLWSPFVKKNEDQCDGNEFVEISDDEEKDENGKKEKCLGVDEEFVKGNGMEMKDKKTRNVRIKMMAKSSNKLLGKGNRVNLSEVFYSEGTKGENIEVEENIIEDDFVFGDEGGKTNENSVVFVVGDDDICVGLQDDFGVGFGDIETSYFG